MKETYQVEAGKTVTITVQVDDALSGDRENLVTELDEAVAQIAALTRRAETAEEDRDRARATWDELMKASAAKVDELIKRADTFRNQAYDQNDKAAALREEVKRLEKTLAESRELADFKTRVADETDEDRAKLWGRVRELEQSLAARDRLLEAATRKAGAVREFLADGRVAEARDDVVTSKGAILADAIGNALRVLDHA